MNPNLNQRSGGERAGREIDAGTSFGPRSALAQIREPKSKPEEAKYQ